MRRNIRVRKARRLSSKARFRRSRGLGSARRHTWQVYIPRNQFPRFFYPILYLSEMYRKITPLRTPVRRRMFNGIRSIFRKVFPLG